jgi:protein TonB
MLKKISLIIFLGVISLAARAQSEDRADPVKTEDERVFMVVEEMPQPKEGMDALGKFIKKNIQKPSTARGISGQVFVAFIVRKDGTLTDASIVKSLHPDCDKEALRIVSIMERWNPGKQNGTTVNTRFVMPIKFR